METSELVDSLITASESRDDDLGELLTAAADTIEQQEADLEEIRSELEETNEGMVALTLELQEAEERYRSLFENAVEGIYRTTPDGREYVIVNSSMAEILGYDSPDSLQAAVDDVCEDVFVDGERHAEYIDQLQSEDQIDNFEYRVRRADGEIRWVSDNARRLEAEDGAGFRGGIVDITELKEYEERLEGLNEELEALNRVVRHDISNDMQVIRAYAEHLRENIDPDHRPQAGKIVTTTDHVIDLTEQARKFIETLTGPKDPELRPVPVGETLRYVVDRARDTYPDAAFNERGEFPEVDVSANDMVSSVFRNLLTNAVKHNTAETPVVDVSAERRGDRVEVRIADNGPGVPDDQKEAIFGKGERSIDSEGTGIGLYLVQVLISNYDGEVWVEDRADADSPTDSGGAVFVVQLPVAE